MSEWVIMHSGVKGMTWNDHLYVRKEGNRYIYSDNQDQGGVSLNAFREYGKPGKAPGAIERAAKRAEAFLDKYGNYKLSEIYATVDYHGWKKDPYAPDPDAKKKG